MSPNNIFIKEDLPAPLCPISATNCPLLIERDIFEDTYLSALLMKYLGIQLLSSSFSTFVLISSKPRFS